MISLTVSKKVKLRCCNMTCSSISAVDTDTKINDDLRNVKVWRQTN